jgi:hypothetical protein
LDQVKKKVTTMTTEKTSREKWLTRTSADGVKKKGQLYFNRFKGRIYYGPNLNPEEKCKREFFLEMHDGMGIPDDKETHKDIQDFILLQCQSIFSDCQESLDEHRNAPFEVDQNDISDEPDGIELNLKFTEYQLKAMKKILSQMIKEHSKTGFEQWDEEVFRDVVACFVAFSNARQKLLKGEPASIPWYHYRID